MKASRVRTALLTLALACSAPMLAPQTALAAPGSRAAEAEAQRLASDGDRAARAKNWSSAADSYVQSVAASPSAPAQAGLANAYYQMKRVVEAHGAYEELLKTYADKLSRPQKAEAELRLKELTDKTGTLLVHVDTNDAMVAIDGRNAGLSPVAPIRVVAGAHTVRVTKDGFVPSESTKDVSGGASATLEVTMSRETTMGRIAVKERNNNIIRVLLDGADIGDTPIEREVTPGMHTVAGRSATMAAPIQTIDVKKGERAQVELVATPAQAHLELKTSDGKGNIYVDGKLAGEGTFSGDVSVGPHAIEVRRDGFDTFRKTVALVDKQVAAETITLVRATAIVVAAEKPDRLFEGVYGGFGLTGVLEAGSMGSEPEIRCGALGATSCDTPASMGGGVFGYVGYTFNPVGFEIMLGGLFDLAKHTARFDGSTAAGANPLVANPPRSESFKMYRFGGLAAFRVRATLQGRVMRASLAAGLGVSYKQMVLNRTATADANGLRDAYLPDNVSYFSPAITVDAAIHLRLGLPTALSLGVLVWAENAGSNTKTPGDPNRTLGPLPLATPEYHTASGAQVFIGPYLGMMFGP